MTFNPNRTATIERSALDEGLRQHMLRVYNYMGLGVGLTGLIAWLVAHTPALWQMLFNAQGHPTILGIVAMFAPLIFILFLSFNAMRMSLAALQGTFWAFCATMGLSLSSIFVYFTQGSIARAFFVTAAMYLATSLYGYTTKADLSKMGSFMVMGLIGIIIASIVNIFLASSAMHFAISVIGVIVFTGLTAWDTQRIKESYAEQYGNEANNKLAVFGALSLYLNFINLFQFMLQFMGARKE